MHVPQLITDLSIILAVAALTGLLFKRLKQPVVLGYILAGILVGPNFKHFYTILEYNSIKVWAEIGVIFLLFNLGLEFSFRKLFKEGSRIIIIALFGVLFTMLFGYLLGKILHWKNTDSLFFGGILSIASTTIIIRAFDELGVKTKKFTNIVTGVLIVEDLAAVILMVILSTVSVSKNFEGTDLIFSVSKLLLFLILWFLSGIFFLPGILKLLRAFLNEEILLIFSLALCFVMVNLALKAGFSPAFGAFMMGSLLAETTKAEKIEHLIAPLKNLFGAIFFVSVGMLFDPDLIAKYWFPILASVIILLVGKPFFIVCGSLLTGQALKISVQTGMSLSQIGEFSFIIASLGLSLGVTSGFLYPIAVAVSVITTFTTPYMMRFSDPVYALLDKKLPERWKQLITQYAAGTQKINETSYWKKLIRGNLINVTIFSAIIIGVIVFATRVIQPYFWNFTYSRMITAGVSILILLPFFWALAFRRGDREAYSKLWVDSRQRGPIVMLQLAKIALALFYLGFLFDRLFSPKIALIGVSLTCLLLILFSKKIQRFYGRIEGRFLENYNERQYNEIRKSKILPSWDTHISIFKLNSHSPFIGKSLIESKIRERFGVNIAAIERDDFIINVPDRHQVLYPGDIISVIGTDEQLKNFQEFLKKNESVPEYLKQKNEVRLLHFVIKENSALAGKSIKESNIRELTKGLVVGIERGEERILNPESTLIFKAGDIVWIVGNEKRIRVLSGETASG